MIFTSLIAYLQYSLSLADVQSRYQAIPYGWREIDIAAVIALLVVDQKITIKDVRIALQKYINADCTNEDLKIIDMDEDGILNITDVRLLLQLFINQ